MSNRKPYFKILRWRRTSVNIKILRTHVRISYLLYYWFTPWDSCGTSWQLLDHPPTEGVCMSEYQGESWESIYSKWEKEMCQHILWSPSLVHNVRSMRGLMAAFGPSPCGRCLHGSISGWTLEKDKIVILFPILDLP